VLGWSRASRSGLLQPARRSGDAIVRVRRRPRASELRDVTQGVDIVNWFSILPGLISIVGWVLHRTAFRSRWIVSAGLDDPADDASSLQLDPMPKREAKRTFLRLLEWTEDGHELQDFQAQRTR
jgi:hypothetical protein